MGKELPLKARALKELNPEILTGYSRGIGDHDRWLMDSVMSRSLVALGY